MEQQQVIQETIVGKRIVAVAWLSFPSTEGACELESITLEDGIKLNLWANDWEGVVAEIEENKDDDA
ncbi:MAG: hypothetical protein E3J81_08100 [Dehalococcoidia bacterium]|nr:MAG: hypothetical protein E3J81_08100 [Dehalococcoidia bacterium]